MDNKERRDAGMPYIADESIFEEMLVTRRRLQKFNRAETDDLKALEQIIKQLIGKVGKNCLINQPFYCDYGTHITLGDNVFMNYNCTILDVANVEIGSNVFMAPNVSIYTAGHPIHPEARNSLYEYGIPIKIGNNVWIGGNTVICPGVQVGDNVVIGAGSVVTKDIPSDVIAAGNPCKVIREVNESDRKYYYKDKEFDQEAWQRVLGMNH